MNPLLSATADLDDEDPDELTRYVLLGRAQQTKQKEELIL